jgi:hypothetical protein
MKNQEQLWALVYETLRPKGNETPNECLNRLTNERKGVPRLRLNPQTTVISLERWSSERLRILDAKHNKHHDFDDFRPIVVIDIGDRKLLVDGNHRVARSLMKEESSEHEVLLLHPTEHAYES